MMIDSRSFGSKKRSINRQKLIKITQKKADEFIYFELPELLENDVVIDEKIYDQKIELLVFKFEKEFTTISDRRVARNYLAKTINDGNKNGKWSLSVPPYIIRIQKQNPFRTMKWFIQSRNLNLWCEKWQNSFENKSAVEEYNESDLLISTLISASFFGGLCIPEMLVALANTLRLDIKPLNLRSDLVWLNLECNCVSQANNIREGSIEKTVRRWYPDPISLSFIHQYLINRNSFLKELCPIKNNTCWKLVKDFMSSIDKETSSSINSFNLFCKASIGVTENISSNHISQVMSEYAIGNVPCASLTPDFQNALLQPINREKIYYNLTKCSKKENLVKLNKIKYVAGSLNYEMLYKEIKDALSTHSSLGVKTTRDDAIEKLSEIKNKNLIYPVLFLIDWLTSLLEVKKLKVVSVSRYFSAIGKVWIANTVGLDVYELGEEDWEQLYIAMLDSETSEKNREYIANRLNTMHLYIAINFELPHLNVPLGTHNKKVKQFIRAGFITEPVFAALCTSINSLEIEDDSFKIGLVCILIMSYRAGLRNSETLKLRMKDIDLSEEKWVTVRENRFGNNKSYSAYRQIPLSILLLPDELILFNHYLADRKRIIGTDTNCLLFSFSNTPFVPIEGQVIRGIVKTFLTSLTGLPVVFYHLRHSALSKLQVVLENDKELINEITLYDAVQVDKIQKTFGNLNNEMSLKNIYWSLAGIAGHLTPETTFAHYFHFSDRLLANKLNTPTQKFSKNAVRQITGLSYNLITRTFKQNSESDGILIQNIGHVIRKNLKPFSNIIESVGEKSSTDDIENSILMENSTIKPRVWHCLSVLKKAEEGATISELILDFQLEESQIKLWIGNAKKLSKLKTTKGKAKLFSKYKAPTFTGLHLAPAEPQSHIENREAEVIIDFLREGYKEHKDELLWCINYFLQNAHSFSSGILFNRPDDLKSFLKLMINALPAERWRLIHSPLNSSSKEEQIEVWKKVSQKCRLESSSTFVKSPSTFPFGKVELFLRHPDEIKLIEKQNNSEKKNIQKYSSNTIVYVFHMLAIMII